MNRQGRSSAEELALREQLTRSRVTRTRVATMTLDGELVDDLTDLFLDGQVNVHARKRASRSLMLALADPGRLLPFDSDSPSPSALGFNRMLQVSYDVRVAGAWMETDVFTGPVGYMRRRGGLAYVRAIGKERLALASSMDPFTVAQGTRKTDAIQQILSERAGETQFNFPDVPGKLPRPVSLGRETTPWLIAQRIAAGMGMQLFYNGSGVCTLRARPETVGFTFTDDEHIKPPGPRTEYTDGIVNAVYVFGGVPLGGKTQVSWLAVAPRDHPLSPWELGRNDVPSWRTRFIHDDTIRTVAEARTVAERELQDALAAHLLLRFEAQPVGYFLDPLDLCQVDTEGLGLVPFRVQRYSFPLAADPTAMPMTMGYLSDLTVDRSARR